MATVMATQVAMAEAAAVTLTVAGREAVLGGLRVVGGHSPQRTMTSRAGCATHRWAFFLRPAILCCACF